jgi:structural maintenance of chromosome 2
MKGVEILGMIEEAAGTRMYEAKKQSALKTMEKKQGKVDEIVSILNTEILPTLERLRSERGLYLTWSANGAEMERLERFCVAHAFAAAEAVAARSEEEVAGMRCDAEQAADAVAELDAEAKEKEVRGAVVMLAVVVVVVAAYVMAAAVAVLCGVGASAVACVDGGCGS